MRLDLRRNGQLSEVLAARIDAIEPAIRAEYNSYIGELVRVNRISGLAWLNQATCRNTFLSLIHDSFCRLALLQELLQQGQSVEVVQVDTRAMQQAAMQLVQQAGCETVVQASGKSRVRPLQWLRNLSRTFYHFGNQWLWPRLFRGGQLPKAPIIYLDSFAFPDSFDAGGGYCDRYYPGLVEIAGSQHEIWYAPTLLGTRTPLDYARLWRRLRRVQGNWLLKEDWLGITDYLGAVRSAFRLPDQIHDIPTWRTLDVSAIVQDECLLDRGSISLAGAVLRYRFIERLSRSRIQVDLAVDWFENQAIDRALSLGFREFYPEVPIHGYQGFVMGGYFASLQPTEYERQAGTLPHRVAVISECLVEFVSENCPALDVEVAPAFRFQSVLDFQRNPDQPRDALLLILPIDIDDARTVLRLCPHKESTQGLHIFVKPHPAFTVVQFRRLVPECDDPRFELTDSPVIELFQRALLMISVTSSVCMEAVEAGVTVVIAGNRSGPTVNPLRGCVPPEQWSLCYSKQCVEQVLGRAVTSRLPAHSQTYFRTVDEPGVREFLTPH